MNKPDFSQAIFCMAEWLDSLFATKVIDVDHRGSDGVIVTFAAPGMPDAAKVDLHVDFCIDCSVICRRIRGGYFTRKDNMIIVNLF